MLELISILFFVAVVVFVFALVGHILWLVGAGIVHAIFDSNAPTSFPVEPESRCHNCNAVTNPETEYCYHCGCLLVHERLADLAATQRTLARLHHAARISEAAYVEVKSVLETEYVSLTNGPQTYSAPFTSGSSNADHVSSFPETSNDKRWQDASVSIPAPAHSSFAIADSVDDIEAPPAFVSITHPQTSDSDDTAPTETKVIKPRRRFSDMLNSFMEESNIRWGEIVGGLLIIGCSTALVVSLWAQISQIPVLKFLIFTTVTAVLFGIGLYTEHRWKLPNTSLGILTIATLLVPLNFLAIAAVSSSAASGSLILASEMIAPAIFLSLVYYAGRVITPGCARFLSLGILLSSIGQLLVRHFATPDVTGLKLVVLGAIPIMCFIAAVGLSLKSVLAKPELNETEVRTLFTMLGTMSFASALPFGLLVYKAGPLGMTMMYLAPTVTMWGLPLLITGVVVWRKVHERSKVATRTSAAAVALLGATIALTGVLLSWPNPASIVPSALISFFVFTAIAVTLELPIAHLLAALCLAVAYVVTYHVTAGHVPWTNLRVFSLLDASLSASTGDVLVAISLSFLAASEWLRKRRTNLESVYYLVAGLSIAIVSLLFVTIFGVWKLEVHHAWLVYLLYAMGTFCIAWRRGVAAFSWAGSALLLFALWQAFANLFDFPFPWQTAFLLHGAAAALGAVVIRQRDQKGAIWKVLYFSGFLSSATAIVCLFQANPWQVTAMQAERVLWIAGTWLVLLWINRKQLLFVAFQIATTAGAILTVKAALQACDWYAYLPHAFLHPTGLLIQGTVLLFVGLAWIAVRIVCRSIAQKHTDHWTNDAWRLLNSKLSIDRAISWTLLGSFLILILYAVASGVTQELAAYGSDYNGYNLAGFPRQEVLGVDSWIVFGLLLVTFLAHAVERRRDEYLLGAIVISGAVVPLIAGLFEPQIAVASAWRWLAAIYLAGGSICLWYRSNIAVRLKAIGWPQLLDNSQSLATRMRRIMVAVTLVPLVLLTLYPSVRAIYYLPVRGAASGIFSILSIDVSYSLPFVIVALVFIGFAVRERSGVFALTGGSFLNAAVTIAYLLSVVEVGGLMDRVVLVRLTQLNAVTSSLFALAWLIYRHRWELVLDDKEKQIASTAMRIQVSLPVILNGLLLTPAVAVLMLWPLELGVGVQAVGSFLGWLAWFTAILAFLSLQRRRDLTPANLFCLLASFVCMLSFDLSGINPKVMTGLHSLTVGMIAIGWLLFGASTISADYFQWITKRPIQTDHLTNWRSETRDYSVVAAACAFVMALRPGLSDPSSDWWAIVSLVALSGLFAVIHSQTWKRAYLLIALLLFNIAGAIWWLSYASKWFDGATAYLQGTTIILALSGIICLILELRSPRPVEEVGVRTFAVSYLAAGLSVVIMSALVIAGLLAPSGTSPLLYFPTLPWIALLSIACLFVASLYDQRCQHAVVGLYITSLFAIGLIIQQTLLPSTERVWLATILLSTLTLVASCLWRGRVNLIDIGRRIGIPAFVKDSTTPPGWLTVLNSTHVAGAGYLALITIFSAENLALRLTAAVAISAQTATFGFFAKGDDRRRWQCVTICMFLIGAVLFGWAWIQPLSATRILNRSSILTSEMFAAVTLLSVWLAGHREWLSDWSEAARRCLPWTIATAAVGMVACLSIEIFDQLRFGALSTPTATFFVITATFVAAAVLLILGAVSPTNDPLRLSERGRMAYVYAAEIMVVLLFVHVRLTMPWLFGSFERYWPFIVMAIAYTGVLVSESLRRQEFTVLARPIESTGAFLPLLPVLGFWIVESEVDYSSVLFIVGGLYGLLSLLRRSFPYGVIAAVCANGALWYFLQRTQDYQFLQHPQLWLIPVALCVLLATHLNEDDFTEDQLTSTRYLSLVTIYLSSTADIVINGVATSPWLPLILGAFSLAGIFGGILLRIRGMLLLGSTFLLFAIITMIWYASANLGWTWLWYVAGIVTGATIIFMFAVFEKKRSDVLRLVEGLRDWER